MINRAIETDRCALFGPEFERLTNATELGATLKECHTRINNSERIAHESSIVLLAHNTALIDTVLRRIYSLAVEHAAALAPCDDEGIASRVPALSIIATGGYGRRELAPYSDVDVTFVTAREDDEYLNAIIKDMFQMVMDVFLYGANLKVGYAYRHLGDLGQLDHQTQTTLLDSRFLCGDRALFKDFRSLFRSQLLTADFLFQKWAERQAIAAKFGGDNVYGIEPNVKEGAGGLRDIHNAEWIGEVRFHVGSSRVWSALVAQNIISEQDADDILSSREFLWATRNALHIISGEARDTLTAEKQESVAQLLAYTEVDDVPAVESFMRDYYIHAAHVKKITRRVIHRCLDSEITMGLGLASVCRSLVVADPLAAERDTTLPLHAAELIHAYELRPSRSLEEGLIQFLEMHPTPPDLVSTGRVFTRLLTIGRGVADVLDDLEEQGVLAWVLPEFGPLMTLIPYDAAHDFTVGAHSLRVVHNLDDLRTTNDPKLLDYKRIIGEIGFPEVLILAGLIHDIGKQWPDLGPHSESGATVAVRIADRLGWDSERRDKLVFLIKQHLLMAETSRLRDLSLDETIREFCRQVPDSDGLNMLYLLTYADTKAVGEGVWSEVQGKFLSELYYRSEAIMTGGPEGGVIPPYVPNLVRQRERIRKQLAQHNLPIDLIHEHTRNLPAQYLLNTPLEEMYLHIAMIGRLRETYLPIVDFRHEFGAEITEMTLCAFDDPKPGLLAKITGVLYAYDINVHVAQVFTREASVPIAIDTLWLDFRGKPLTSTKKAEVQEGLRSVLLGNVLLTDLLQKRNKPQKEQLIYSAKIDDHTSDRFSVLEVSAPDEKGVVYRLGAVISSLGWDIHAARLSVWGSRARDAFYITDAQGTKIPADDVNRLLAVLPSTPYSKRKLSSQLGS